MNRKLIYIIIGFIFVGASILAWLLLRIPKVKVKNFDECLKAGYPVLESFPRQCKAPNGTFTEDVGNSVEKMNLIKVTTPTPNQTIESPITIEGEARGYWFFEASFPIKIYDENDQLLGSTIAQAQIDWMTENFVPFRARLDFNPPTTQKGKLVLEKDNPSGLPENADEIHFPINFKTVVAPAEIMTVKAFFNNDQLDPEISCNKVFPVERIVPKTQVVARAALEELLKGPTEMEKIAGYSTSIPTKEQIIQYRQLVLENGGQAPFEGEEIKINSLKIENGIAFVDFSSELEAYGGGSCRVAAIRAQITYTLKQFPTVNSVIISINGRTEDILQP